MATLSEPTWGSPIVYANSVAWGAEPAISSSRFMPGVIFGAVLPDYRTNGTGWLVLASGVGDDSGTDNDRGDDNSGDDGDGDSGDSDRNDSVIDDGDGGDDMSDDDNTDSDSGDDDSGDDESEENEDTDDTDDTDYGGGDTGGGDTGGGGTGGGDTGGGGTGGGTGGGVATPSEPTPGEAPTVPGVQAGRPVSTDPAVRPRIGSGGGSWSRAVSSDDNPFEPYFENNVSPQNLAKILAYFGLLDRFAVLPDDGQVDIVWLEFERKPSLKGLSVVIDGTAQVPDLSAVAGKLAVLVFLDQSTLTKGSDVVAVFGNADPEGANMARRRPLR